MLISGNSAYCFLGTLFISNVNKRNFTILQKVTLDLQALDLNMLPSRCVKLMLKRPCSFPIVHRLCSTNSQSSSNKDEKISQDLVISFDEETGIQTLRLNRPKRLNAINSKLYAAIPSALIETCDDPKVKITVLTGTGRYFCSGNDLPDMAKRW